MSDLRQTWLDWCRRRDAWDDGALRRALEQATATLVVQQAALTDGDADDLAADIDVLLTHHQLLTLAAELALIHDHWRQQRDDQKPPPDYASLSTLATREQPLERSNDGEELDLLAARVASVTDPVHGRLMRDRVVGQARGLMHRVRRRAASGDSDSDEEGVARARRTTCHNICLFLVGVVFLAILYALVRANIGCPTSGPPR